MIDDRVDDGPVLFDRAEHVGGDLFVAVGVRGLAADRDLERGEALAVGVEGGVADARRLASFAPLSDQLVLDGE